MSFSIRPTRRSRLKFVDDPGLTEQHHKDSCDMSLIMRRYEKTGAIDHIKQYKGEYLDMPSGTDFQTAMNVIAEANSMFETVPSNIRNKFRNDPAAYLDYMQDPKNKKAIIDMGLDASHLPDLPPEPAAGDGSPDPSPAGGNTAEEPPATQ